MIAKMTKGEKVSMNILEKIVTLVTLSTMRRIRTETNRQSQVFAFVETKQTAEYVKKDEIKDKVIGENLYQLRKDQILDIIVFRHCLMEQ